MGGVDLKLKGKIYKGHINARMLILKINQIEKKKKTIHVNTKCFLMQEI